MRPTRTLRLSALAVLVVLAVTGPFLLRKPLHAQPAPPAQTEAGGFGGEGGAQEIPQVYVQGPVTAEAAATWLKLQKRIDMPFANETPLDDLLKHLQAATADEPPKENAPPPKDASHRPLQIYVDPVGLQEAEKTMQSPITVNLEGIPASTGLQLALKQLGLTYFVQKDGILVIVANGSSHEEMADPTLHILNTLTQLRGEINQLKLELAAARRHVGGANPPVSAGRGAQ